MNEAQKSKKRLHKELKQLVADTTDLLGTTTDVADAAGKAARAKVEASLKTVQNQIESGVSSAGDMAEEQLHVIDQHVRDNPYITMGISFGAGALLGFLVGHK